MRIDILTAVPGLLEGVFSHSIVHRAQTKGLIEVHVHNLRDYTTDKHRKVDDYPFGGQAGMVIKIEPIDRAITALKAERDYDHVIFMSPDAPTLNQNMCNRLSLGGNLIILCGHYKGIDERAREHFVTLEISIGDFVLSGGEIPAALLVDAIARIIPGVLGDETSALSDSFQDGLLSAPVYTRPANYNGWEVPSVLLSGHDRNIRLWQEQQALERTRSRRPDLLQERKED